MARTKKRAVAVCSHCGSSEAMYVTLKDGGKLPSFAWDMATGARFCFPCYEERGRV